MPTGEIQDIITESLCEVMHAISFWQYLFILLPTGEILLSLASLEARWPWTRWIYIATAFNHSFPTHTLAPKLQQKTRFIDHTDFIPEEWVLCVCLCLCDLSLEHWQSGCCVCVCVCLCDLSLEHSQSGSCVCGFVT
jgi:hypothetical protein